jgi:hypothetical protein
MTKGTPELLSGSGVKIFGKFSLEGEFLATNVRSGLRMEVWFD